MFPILIELGPITIYTYGLFVALGIFAGLEISIFIASAEDIPKEQARNYFYQLLIYFVLGGIIGARIFYVFLFWEQFRNDFLAIFKIHQGGMVSFGGLVGALAGFFLFYRKNKKFSMGKVLDWLAPGLAFGHALGRMGCLFAGCCYGKPIDTGWGIIFTHPQSLAPLNISLHPTQLYESFFLFLVGTFLLWHFFRIKNNPQRKNGFLFIHYLLLYSLGRFIIEFFRGDQAQIWILSEGQIFSFLTFSGVLFLRFHIYKKILLTKAKKSD